MSRAIPKFRDFAQRLIIYEMNGKNAHDSTTPAAFIVTVKLRPSLATLMGKAGFDALILRALTLASSDVPWLLAVHFKSDGSFEGLHEMIAQRKPDEIVHGGVVLLAQLLGLLVTFIGEDLQHIAYFSLDTGPPRVESLTRLLVSVRSEDRIRTYVGRGASLSLHL